MIAIIVPKVNEQLLQTYFVWLFFMFSRGSQLSIKIANHPENEQTFFDFSFRKNMDHISSYFSISYLITSYLMIWYHMILHHKTWYDKIWYDMIWFMACIWGMSCIWCNMYHVWCVMYNVIHIYIIYIYMYIYIY